MQPPHAQHLTRTKSKKNLLQHFTKEEDEGEKNHPSCQRNLTSEDQRPTKEEEEEGIHNKMSSSASVKEEKEEEEPILRPQNVMKPPMSGELVLFHHHAIHFGTIISEAAKNSGCSTMFSSVFNSTKDVTIVPVKLDAEDFVEHEELRAHRIILAAFSDYFARTFFEGRDLAGGGVVVLGFVTHQHMRAIVSLIYEGYLDLSQIRDVPGLVRSISDLGINLGLLNGVRDNILTIVKRVDPGFSLQKSISVRDISSLLAPEEENEEEEEVEAPATTETGAEPVLTEIALPGSSRKPEGGRSSAVQDRTKMVVSTAKESEVRMNPVPLPVLPDISGQQPNISGQQPNISGQQPNISGHQPNKKNGKAKEPDKGRKNKKQLAPLMKISKAMAKTLQPTDVHRLKQWEAADKANKKKKKEEAEKAALGEKSRDKNEASVPGPSTSAAPNPWNVVEIPENPICDASQDVPREKTTSGENLTPNTKSKTERARFFADQRKALRDEMKQARQQYKWKRDDLKQSEGEKKPLQNDPICDASHDASREKTTSGENLTLSSAVGNNSECRAEEEEEEDVVFLVETSVEKEPESIKDAVENDCSSQRVRFVDGVMIASSSAPKRSKKSSNGIAIESSSQQVKSAKSIKYKAWGADSQTFTPTGTAAAARPETSTKLPSSTAAKPNSATSNAHPSSIASTSKSPSPTTIPPDPVKKSIHKNKAPTKERSFLPSSQRGTKKSSHANSFKSFRAPIYGHQNPTMNPRNSSAPSHATSTLPYAPAACTFTKDMLKVFCEFCPSRDAFNTKVGKEDHDFQFHSCGYLCSVCRQLFVSKEVRAVHAEFTHKDRCHVCGLRFLSSFDMEFHMNVWHQQTSTSGKTTFDCQLCHSVFSTKTALKLHLRITHQLDVQDNADAPESAKKSAELCQICFAIFPVDQTFEFSHECVATPFTCRVCDKTFRGYDPLHIHLNAIHGKEVICPICGESAKDVEAYKKHQAFHRRHVMGGIGCACCRMWFFTEEEAYWHKNSAYHFVP